MSNIEMYRSGALGVSRSVGRVLSQVQGVRTIAVARVEARVDIQAAQIDGVAAAAQRAMQGVAFVSQIEQQLGQAVPIAVTRLQAIGDLAALSMGQVVTDTVTKLRRL